MDKRTFFDHYHAELAKKFNLQTETIGTIRSFILGQKKTPDGLRSYAREHIAYLRSRIPPGVVSPRLNRWREILKTLARNEKIDFLLQKTKFDK